MLRACSDKQEYLKIQRKMYQIFRDRNYPKTLLERALESVPFESRPQTLEKKDKSSQKYDTFLVVEYTPDLDIKLLRQTLKPNQSEEKQVPTPCLSLKRPKNLSQKLVRAKLRQFPDPPQSTLEINIPITPNFNGNSAACATPGCKCCRLHVLHLAASAVGECPGNPKSHLIRTTNHTKTHKLPDHQCYIPPGMHEMPQKKGQTQRTIGTRFAGHRAASKTKTNLPLYKHFTDPLHDFREGCHIHHLGKDQNGLSEGKRKPLDKANGHNLP